MNVLENIHYALILFLQISLVHARCESEPLLVCCPDEVWDDERRECIGCRIGYSGINCTTSCRFPGYGKNCQLRCSCTAEFCSPSFGCTKTQTQAVNKETTETTPRHIETTTITTVTTDQTTDTRTSSNVQTDFDSTENTKSRIGVLNKVDAKVPDNANFMSSPFYLGLFVFACLFIVLFAVFVGTQIRHKCFKRNHSDRDAQLKSYDVIDTKQNEVTQSLNRSPKAETPPEQRDSHYTDIETYCEKEDRTNYEKVPHPSTSNTASNICLHNDGPTQDKTIPKYVEIIGSPKPPAESTKTFSVISNTYTCDITNPKQLY